MIAGATSFRSPPAPTATLISVEPEIDMNVTVDAEDLPSLPYGLWGGWAAAVGCTSDFEDARRADPSIHTLLNKLDRLEQADHSIDGLLSALRTCEFSRDEINRLNSPLLDGILLAFNDESKANAATDSGRNGVAPADDQPRFDPVYSKPPLSYDWSHWERALRRLLKAPPSVTFEWLLRRAPPDFAKTYTPVLFACISWGRCDFVHLLLKRGADPNANRGNHFTHACLKGYLDIVKLLVQAGADLHATDEAGLRFAAMHGATQVVEFLLDAGADVDAVGDSSIFNCDESSAVMMAAYGGQVGMIRLLCARGCDLKRDGEEALCMAVTARELGAMNELLDRGVLLTSDRPLEFVFEGTARLRSQALDLLLRRGANVQIALNMVIDSGEIDLIPVLLPYGADVTARHHLLLFFVLLHGDVAISEAILERCPAADQLVFRQRVDAAGWPGLMLLLRDQMPRHEYSDEDALMTAVKSDACSMVRALLPAAFASHNVNDLKRHLQRAIACKSLDAVTALLDHGCDLAGLQQTISFLAQHANGYRLLDLLIARGFNVRKLGRMVLDTALRHKQTEIARLLIQHGADTAGISPEALSGALDASPDIVD